MWDAQNVIGFKCLKDIKTILKHLNKNLQSVKVNYSLFQFELNFLHSQTIGAILAPKDSKNSFKQHFFSNLFRLDRERNTCKGLNIVSQYIVKVHVDNIYLMSHTTMLQKTERIRKTNNNKTKKEIIEHIEKP